LDASAQGLIPPDPAGLPLNEIFALQQGERAMLTAANLRLQRRRCLFRAHFPQSLTCLNRLAGKTEL